MKKIALLIVVIGLFFVQSVKSQTVIEMTHPEDAHLTLLVVNDINDADIVVYKTDKKSEYELWDCMWKFKRWGFSNFAIYLTKESDDALLKDNDDHITRRVHGKIYFTENKEERGYRNKDFRLEGVFRKLPK